MVARHEPAGQQRRGLGKWAGGRGAAEQGREAASMLLREQGARQHKAAGECLGMGLHPGAPQGWAAALLLLPPALVPGAPLMPASAGAMLLVLVLSFRAADSPLAMLSPAAAGWAPSPLLPLLLLAPSSASSISCWRSASRCLQAATCSNRLRNCSSWLSGSAGEQASWRLGR